MATAANTPDNLTEYLLSIRDSRSEPLITVPEVLIPADEHAAYEIQDRVARQLGDIRGWKVGAGSPDAVPAAAPLHAETIFPNGAVIPAEMCRHRGAEAEIAYRFRHHPEGDPANTTRETVLNAIESVHPVIELVDTRFAEPGSQHRLAHLADQQSHGVLIVGDAIRNWCLTDSFSETITVRVDHGKSLEKVARNAAGDPIRLLMWLAGHAVQRGMPFGAGTIVTTGSLTGTLFVPHRTHLSAEFGTSGRVSTFLA
ncbi:2-keto-4-pentenoate hydratase [Acetobacter oeni]|uniref:Hydratase n=1 Tax=Acetobacter oeni TaxID=304077 RepID=A0A511XGH3_9PROT|nr:2-keto-4-pentenoate hydratase [Acetobacter oeni]MBB3881797.1 2-keto-4-pentenoate hydratase [Acetobacter oeni]NHO17401.1 2-keto-4-pentenoate hydratase [Acetobacter oeni]GEN62029.1 hydratase [Acetobacter oeni]